jgi:16S rRNA (cytidine1402-2'-O)-methyltransferase
VIILAATPIGNLSDASPRLREHLENAKFIAAEDTRTTLKLAQALGIHLNAKLFSLNEQNEGSRLEQLVQIATDDDLLVVSDAGMPTVSDPGFLLVRAAVAAGVEVIAIPGPSAVVTALAVSGLPTDRFTFEGFLPRKSGDRKRSFGQLLAERRTMVFFEAPHRIHESLLDALEIFGPNRQAAVARELTKKFEQTVRGPISELVEWASVDHKGEMVLVIAGAAEESVEAVDLVAEVKQLTVSGIGMKQAVSQVASMHGVSKSELYQASLDARN